MLNTRLDAIFRYSRVRHVSHAILILPFLLQSLPERRLFKSVSYMNGPERHRCRQIISHDTSITIVTAQDRTTGTTLGLS